MSRKSTKQRETVTKLILDVIDEVVKGREDVGRLAKEFYMIYREKGLEGVRRRVEELIEEVLHK